MGKVKKDKTSKTPGEIKNKPHSPKKKKSSDKKGSDEWNQKYGMILPQSIKFMAESIGIGGLSDEVSNNLSEDVSYRLRSVVQLCSKYLKHTKHKRLRCDDVNEVFSMCDIPPVIGFSAYNAPSKFVNIDDSNLFLIDDVEIDLCTYVLDETIVGRKVPTSLTGQWLTAEECQNSKTEDETDGARVSQPLGNSNVKADADGKISESSKTSEPNVPQNLIKYFVITCTAILGRSDLKIVNRDLSRSEKIMPIVPFILNFISKTLTDLNSERIILRLLNILQSLTQNTRVDFRPYQPVTNVCQALMKIIKSSPGENIDCGNYSYSLRIQASKVLARVNQLWCDNERDYNDLVTEAHDLLLNAKLPARIHVAAITLLNNLPPHAMRIAFWNYLPSFLKYSQMLQQDKSYFELSILEAAQRLYRNPYGSEVTECIPAPDIDRILYEHFGDSLCPIRLQLLENPKFLMKHFSFNEASLEYKNVDNAAKGTWRLPKCINPMYNPEAKRPTIHTAFRLPILTKKRNPRILFKFAGANPVPEMSLKRRRLDSRYSQFIAGKVSEGHVVLVGKFWKRPKLHTNNFYLKNALISSVL